MTLQPARMQEVTQALEQKQVAMQARGLLVNRIRRHSTVHVRGGRVAGACQRSVGRQDSLAYGLAPVPQSLGSSQVPHVRTSVSVVLA